LTSESKKTERSKAAGLKYNPESDPAPVVIASGYGPTAEKIIDIAEQNGIPVYKDDSAASLLCMLDVGSNIPTELYKVVATIYSQIIAASQKIIVDQGTAESPGGNKGGRPGVRTT